LIVFLVSNFITISNNTDRTFLYWFFCVFGFDYVLYFYILSNRKFVTEMSVKNHQYGHETITLTSVITINNRIIKILLSDECSFFFSPRVIGTFLMVII